MAPPSPAAAPRPRWPWHGAGSSRVHLNHAQALTCSNTQARHSPKDAVAKTAAWPLPRDGRKTRPGAEDGCRGAKLAPLAPPNPFAPSLHPPRKDKKGGGGSGSHLPLAILIVMKADGAMTRELLGCLEELTTRPSAKPSVTSQKAALTGALKQHRNFITFKTTPGRFLLASPTVYQTAGGPAKQGRVHSPPVHGGVWATRFWPPWLRDASSTQLKPDCPAAKAAPTASCSRSVTTFSQALRCPG